MYHQISIPHCNTHINDIVNKDTRMVLKKRKRKYKTNIGIGLLILLQACHVNLATSSIGCHNCIKEPHNCVVPWCVCSGGHFTILCVNTCVKGVFKRGYHIIGIFEVYFRILMYFFIHYLIIHYLNFKHPILHLNFSKFYCSWIKYTLYSNAPCLLIFLSVLSECVWIRASRCHMAHVCVIQLLLNVGGDFWAYTVNILVFSKPNQVHVVIFWFFFIKLMYIT